MLLREPFYVENMGRDQPYLSMLLIAPYCTFKCQGCQNKHLGNGKLKEFTTQELIKLYNSNPFFQGITVGGLEIFDSGEKFLVDFINFIEKGEISKVTIYTRQTSENEKVKEFIKVLINISTLKEIYLKTGEFKLTCKNENTVQIKNWKIYLYNKEQNFKRLK